MSTEKQARWMSRGFSLSELGCLQKRSLYLRFFAVESRPSLAAYRAVARTLAAEKVTPEAINFMVKYGRGLVCLAMTEERLDHLRVGPMTAENTSNYGTAFCEAIDARDGVTTGISAYDRSRTIQVAIDPATRPSDLARPGHVFPLRARKGGVLVRAGQTEASVDLARLAGLVPAGIICEIMRDDESMAV